MVDRRGFQMKKSERAAWFSDRVLYDYYRWRSTLPRGSRRGVRYRGLITRYGALGAAKRLLNSQSNRRKRESFGIEYLVIEPQFKPLFTGSEIAEAKSRLK